MKGQQWHEAGTWMSSLSGSNLATTPQMRRILLLEDPWKMKKILYKLVFNSRMEEKKVER